MMPYRKIKGLIEPGNIDLAHRPVVQNPDGGFSTVLSTSVNLDGKEYLIPQVSDSGEILSLDQAIELFRKTGKHLGVFDSPENATSYAKRLHSEQEQEYKSLAEKLYPNQGK